MRLLELVGSVHTGSHLLRNWEREELIIRNRKILEKKSEREREREKKKIVEELELYFDFLACLADLCSFLVTDFSGMLLVPSSPRYKGSISDPELGNQTCVFFFLFIQTSDRGGERDTHSEMITRLGQS